MRDWKIIIYRNPAFSKCPDCKESTSLHKSRPRDMTEQIAKRLTFFRTYRCKNCGWRGYKSTLTFSKDSLKAILLYTGIIIAVAIIVKYILTKFIR